MRLTVIGCGYLGTTHAACMAELGHDVLGIETDPSRIESLLRGEVPFFEPDLADLLRRHVESGRLRFTSDLDEAADFADLHFLCVGTPQLPGTLGADTSQVTGAIETLAPRLKPGAVVIGKSTVPVGTARGLLPALETAGAELVWNPEFLREGYAVHDTLRPDRIVLGGDETSAGFKAVREFYGPLLDAGTPLVTCDFETAELVKVSANAFLATKISFINAVSEICEVTGADVVKLAEAIGHDDRIGNKFLGAGIGFGGGCLPKDIRAFQHRAGELGVEEAMSFLGQIDAINQRRRVKTVGIARSLVGNLVGAKIAVLGAAFKPNSDDVRDSPALWIAGQLHLAGAKVRVHDPKAMPNAERVFPTLKYRDTPQDACKNVDLVLHLTEWPEYADLDPAKLREVVATPQLIDGRNKLDPHAWRSAGWTFRGLGRP